MKLSISTKSSRLKAGIEHEVEAESVQVALDACVKDLAAAHAQYSNGRDSVEIVIWQEGKLVGRWKLDLVLPVLTRIADNCPTCGGEGCVDSGGFSPWGASINIPCPSCANGTN